MIDLLEVFILIDKITYIADGIEVPCDYILGKHIERAIFWENI